MNICKEKGALCIFAQASGYCCSTVCLGRIEKRPTIELKRGRWIVAEDIGDCCYKCSNCGFIRDAYVLDVGKYCPNCGAKMESE